MEANILIIDDDEDILLSAQLLLKREYSNVITQNNPKEINQLISTVDLDLILLDMNYRVGFNDGKEGIYWLKRIKEVNPEIAVILMTAYGEVELAVEAIKIGALDFILKPWNNEKLLNTIRTAVELKHSKKKIKGLETATNPENTNMVIGSSEAMKELQGVIDKVSDTSANVLILGENGTGKQHIARKIHEQSNRKNEVFIHIDLGSLSESLFESELFGHKKGSFTDAKEDQPGRLELAMDGTIFLDEIGNLPLHLQVKLLRVLQDRKFNRIGDSVERHVNARFIFATNAPIYEWVKEEKFREDLLYRINTIEINIPPLRDRQTDIPEFLDHFLQVYKAKYKKSELVFSKDAIQLLLKHHWPGNIRELQHTVERGVIMSDGHKISPSDFRLSSEEAPSSSIDDLNNLNVHEIEKLLVQKALSKHDGNITKASKDLGLTRAALYRRMEKYNL